MHTFPRQKLEALLSFVYRNQYSDFYHSRFPEGFSVPLTQEYWERIPFTTRAEISAVPIWGRVHVPHDEVHFIRHTSGSSGNAVLVSPRTTFGSYEDPYGHVPIRRVLYFLFPAYHDFPREEASVEMIMGDAGDLRLSARIGKLAYIDSICITPQTALIFAGYLKECGILSNIRTLILSGERCSPLQLAKIHELYKGAVIFSIYGASETREAIAYPCAHDRAGGDAFRLESSALFYCEIIDPISGKVIVETGVYGELVVSTIGAHVPFPHVRYRTGDTAVYRARECACANHAPAFEVQGRSSILPIRVTKGEISADAAERAIVSIKGMSTSYFEVHFYEEELASTVLPRVRLILLKPETGIQTSKLSRELADNFHIAPTYTYADGVAEGLYLPLEVSFIDAAPNGPMGKPKSPIVVRHIQDNEREGIQVASAR